MRSPRDGAVTGRAVHAVGRCRRRRIGRAPKRHQRRAKANEERASLLDRFDDRILRERQNLVSLPGKLSNDFVQALGLRTRQRRHVRHISAHGVHARQRRLDLVLDDVDMGYTLKAMQVALWCAVQASDFEESLVAVVSAGGDTDTNGAVAGAVLGARFGLNAIPSRWRERLAEVRQGREPLEALADLLMAGQEAAI